MIRLIFAALLMLAPASGTAQQPAEAQASATAGHWGRSETQILSLRARTAFPIRAGSLTFASTGDFSHPDIGTDSGLQYRSGDGELIGTIYVYLPGLAHTGLAAYATEQAMRAGSDTPVRLARTAVLRAGNAENAAIRTDYENYRGRYFSSAAFIKAGRWMIKIRVSGPSARRSEIEAAVEALLAGVRFGARNPTLSAAPVEVRDCSPDEGARDATLLPDPPGAELGAHGFLALFDGGGNIATNERGERDDLPSRVPRQLCLSSRLQLGQTQVPILRGPDGPPISADGRTRLVALITDNGAWLEVVHAQNLGRYLMLYHQIGATSVLGSYDNVPSDRQIAKLLNNPSSEAGRVRVPVRFWPDRPPEMHLPALPAGSPTPAT